MHELVTVAVDANGADLGPEEVARGAAMAVRSSGVRVLLYGPAEKFGPQPDGVEVIDAPISLAKASDPASAVRAEPTASIVQACRAVGEGRADAFVSGGSTGAALAAGLFEVKRAKGVFRPALALLIPVPEAPFLLLDAGANISVRPEHLAQFAHMGAAFMEIVGGVKNPRVALLSNGTEATKGPDLVQATRALLEANPGDLNFTGFVEGFAVGDGSADVIVTDGFTGNVTLKVMEATSATLFKAIHNAAHSTPRSRVGGLLLRPALRRLRTKLDPEEQGGAVLLGLQKLGVIPHGSFGARGIARAIDFAVRGVHDDLVGRTDNRLRVGNALKRAPELSAQPATVTDSP